MLLGAFTERPVRAVFGLAFLLEKDSNRDCIHCQNFQPGK